MTEDWGSEWDPALYYRMTTRGRCSGGTPSIESFDPLTLDPSIWLFADPLHLYVDLDHTSFITAPNDPVGSWRNLGSDGDFFVAPGATTERPLYKTGSGLKWVEADGVNDSLLGPCNITGFDFYVAAAFAPLSTDGFDRMVSVSDGVANDFSSAVSCVPVLQLNTASLWGGFSNSAAGASVLGVDDGTAYVVESIYSEAEHRFGVNGVLSDPVSSAHDLASDRMRLFDIVSMGNRLNGRLFALFARPGPAPSGESRSMLLSKLATLSGVTL